MGSGVSAQKDAGKADRQLGSHTAKRILRLVTGPIKAVAGIGPGQVGGHVVQQFPDYIDLPAAVAPRKL